TPPAPSAQPAPAGGGGREPDIAYGAFQRGYFLTAFHEATKRVNAGGDPKAMTLLGELYANGLGVPNNDLEAARSHKLTADPRDREAMCALAMFPVGGRGGPRGA